MKHFLHALFFALVLISCSQGNQDAINELAENSGNENKYTEGEQVYLKTCVACHQKSGEGVIGAFPPLAGSDYLLEDKTRAINQIKNGSSGVMVVNGETYDNIMPPQGLSDEEIRDVLNYILNSWGNKGGEVTLDEVKSVQ